MLKQKNGHSKKTTENISAQYQNEGRLMLREYRQVKHSRKAVFNIEKVIKSDGKVEEFSLDKLSKSIFYAGRDTKAYGKKEAFKIFTDLTRVLSKYKAKTISSLEIRSLVEPLMAEEGYFQTARYYILYKERKEQARRAAFKIREPHMSENAKLTLVSKCSMQSEDGTLLESPGQIFWRVAKHLAKAEFNWADETQVEKIAQKFFDKMVSFKFVCTRSALYEAGNDMCIQQLSPCFVLKVEDSISSIFSTLGEAALVQKNYGGTGFNFSNIRFRGDKARNVPSAASGPVDFLQVYSAALSKVMQGAKRHGGNMGILDVNHPDIYEFISVKDNDGTIKNFNVSVGATNEFMEAVLSDSKFNLVNPRDKSVVKKVKAKTLFRDICKHAWATGDPGMIFLDRMEEDNYTPTLGVLNATNPCGEQPLLPYESCNLSSVHLARHLVKKNNHWEMDWDELSDTVKTVVRFLDNMIEVNTYVLSETEKLVKYGNRKIGVGMIGFAETLFKMGVSYNSAEGTRLADKIAKFVKQKAEDASLDLAKVRGVFPNWDISTYKGTSEKYRNCTMITIAPTGTVSMIGDTTSGVEPCFALVYTRRSFYEQDKSNNSTTSLYYIDPSFESVLKERGIYSKDLIKRIADGGGSIQNMKEIPADIRKVFVTTHDIAPEWHVRIQAAFQRYADNAVSKTINFAHNASVEDVENAYILAWKLGCKGITIYRDGSKNDQVLNTGVKTQKKLGDVSVDSVAYVVEDDSVCPECDGTTFTDGGCVTCRDCGWSKCKI